MTEHKQTLEALKRLADYLEKDIEPRELATKLRTTSYMLTQLKLKERELEGWNAVVEDANYHLHLLAETLNPQLDDLF